MRKPAILLTLLLACISLAGRSNAQILNGSFEPTTPFGGNFIVPTNSTAIPGWLTIDSGVEWYNPLPFGTGPAPAGNYIVDLANYVYSAGGLQQTFATTPGEQFVIDFKLSTTLGAGRDGTAQIEVSADGQTQLFNVTNLTGVNVWQACTFTFTADNSSATLRFRCLQNANVHFANIDGVARNLTTAARPSTFGRIKSLYR